jgi:hypothetical protein
MIYTQDEEERYARCLIQSYAAGLFELPRGQTLRFFIATKLRCSPMRVTKKFPGSTLLLTIFVAVWPAMHATMIPPAVFAAWT